MHAREASADVRVNSSRLGRCTRTELLDEAEKNGAGPVEVAYGRLDIERLYG